MTPREPDRFDAQAEELWTAWRNNDPVGTIAAALRAEHASALERAAQIVNEEDEGRTGRGFELGDVGDFRKRCVDGIRALIPPAAAPEAHRDTPCGRCGHPLWWHQWSSKEHRFCSKPLGRDFCRCKNYEKPAAGPAAEREKHPLDEAIDQRMEELRKGAAPVADYDPITAPIPAGDMNGPHGPLPAAETGKAPDEALRLLALVARKWTEAMTEIDASPLVVSIKEVARATPPEKKP